MKRTIWVVRHCDPGGGLGYAPDVRKPGATDKHPCPRACAQEFPEKWMADEFADILNEMLLDLAPNRAAKRKALTKFGWKAVEG